MEQQFPQQWFDRVDESPDTDFYVQPRFVQHIDEGAIAVVTNTIRRHVAPGSDVLDLMSSWVSHLPPERELAPGRVVGVGLNADELRRNPRLAEWAVQDLNVDPRLAFADWSFDAVLITVSIQYLTRPVEVFREVGRVLRPGGLTIVSFSNRLFPTKAVRVWQETTDNERPALVAAYLDTAGGFDRVDFEAHRPPRSRWGGGADPLWAVIAHCADDRSAAGR